MQTNYLTWPTRQACLVRISLIKRIVQTIPVTLPEKYEATISSSENSKDLSSITLAELVKALQTLEQRRIMRKEGSVEGDFHDNSHNNQGGCQPPCPFSEKTNRSQ